MNAAPPAIVNLELFRDADLTWLEESIRKERERRYENSQQAIVDKIAFFIWAFAQLSTVRQDEFRSQWCLTHTSEKTPATDQASGYIQDYIARVAK